ncbi:MAG: hypothetical protein ACE5EG_03845, partial [Thermoanaerobaculia bacterium]
MLVLLLAGLLRLTWDLVAHRDQLSAGDDLRFPLLLALRCAALAAAVWGLALAARWERPERPPTDARRLLVSALRSAALILLTAIAVASVAQLATGPEDQQFVVRSAFRSALLLATSVWVGLLTRAPGNTANTPRRPSAWFGVVLVNVFLALVALESVALLFSRFYPTRLLWDESSARATIEANRLEPGSRYLGFPANSGGYYDEEFHRAGPDDLVVALLADSFGLGIVPHKHNLATVAERHLARHAPVLGRVAVHNFGVASIGLPEYVWLLENEVPATAPTRIVLGLFVGNDISGLASRRQPGFYSLQQFQLFEIGRRLAALGRISRGPGSDPWPTRRKRRAPEGHGEGTLAEETFLDIEQVTVEMCNTRSRKTERLYRDAFEWLARACDEHDRHVPC